MTLLIILGIILIIFPMLFGFGVQLFRKSNKPLENSLLPPKGFLAINLFGLILCRRGNKSRINAHTVRHEAIHTAQMRNMLYSFFYIWYGIEWFIKLWFCIKEAKTEYENQKMSVYMVVHRSFLTVWSNVAYYNVSFEREAYQNDSDITYLSHRKFFNHLKYLKK